MRFPQWPGWEQSPRRNTFMSSGFVFDLVPCLTGCEDSSSAVSCSTESEQYEEITDQLSQNSWAQGLFGTGVRAVY